MKTDTTCAAVVAETTLMNDMTAGLTGPMTTRACGIAVTTTTSLLICLAGSLPQPLNTIVE